MPAANAGEELLYLQLCRLAETVGDVLEKISASLPAGAKLCLAIYTPDKTELDIVLQEKGSIWTRSFQPFVGAA